MGSELDQELNRLPRKYRVPLILCYLKGRTHDQAAEEMACPVGTVRSRLARGRDLLRRRLTARGHASMAAHPGPRHGSAGGTFQRIGSGVPGFRHGQGGRRSRCIPNPTGRRGGRVGPGPQPRSAHDHENCAVEIDQPGHRYNEPVGWGRHRRCVCRGAGPGHHGAGKRCPDDYSPGRNKFFGRGKQRQSPDKGRRADSLGI